mgnify:CR=1 FL=1
MRRVGETVRCEGAPLGVGGRDRRWGRAAARQPVPRGPRPEGSESEEGTPEDAARGGETDGAAELEPEPEPQPEPEPEFMAPPPADLGPVAVGDGIVADSNFIEDDWDDEE